MATLDARRSRLLRSCRGGLRTTGARGGANLHFVAEVRWRSSPFLIEVSHVLCHFASGVHKPGVVEDGEERVSALEAYDNGRMCRGPWTSKERGAGGSVGEYNFGNGAQISL